MFTKHFDSYVIEGESITCDMDGFTLRATVCSDDDADAPWDREDGHGPVTDWMNKDDKRAGYLVLHQDQSSYRFYNFAEAVKIAKRDGWGAPKGHFRADATPTKGEIAAAAAMADYKVLKAWCNDEWTYCGIRVMAMREGIVLGRASLWGIDCNYPVPNGEQANTYLLEVANELLPEAIADARKTLAKLCQQ